MPQVENCKRKIPVYDDGLAVREWIHSEDHVSAIMGVLNGGSIGESYNIGSGIRCRNWQMLKIIFEACKRKLQKTVLGVWLKQHLMLLAGEGWYGRDMTFVTLQIVQKYMMIAKFIGN